MYVQNLAVFLYDPGVTHLQNTKTLLYHVDIMVVIFTKDKHPLGITNYRSTQECIKKSVGYYQYSFRIGFSIHFKQHKTKIEK